MLKVVSNTTPIISLLKISKLEILKNLYDEIFIPNAVYEELEAGLNKEYYKDLTQINWINIVPIKSKSSHKYFIDLDKGEAEAIILATEIQADLIIIDEKIGRYYANHADLKVTGTLGVLLKAKKEGLIKEIKPILNELIIKGIWISDKLYKELSSLAGECD